MPMETDRLILREVIQGDFDSWYAILSDAETMRHYPAPFDAAKVRQWIEWSIDNYARYGFGLWAVVLKETGEMIGDCGITMQNINGKQLPEIGYHISKAHQQKGYASEAALRCLNYAFEERGLEAVYSYMKYTNEPSYKSALKIGLHFVEEYPDPVNTFTRVYVITREEWQRAQDEKEKAKG